MEKPWASFCMSTYKRPDYLKIQLGLLLQQTFPNFEIVVSDNDSDASSKAICDSFNDSRIKYYTNAENLGMVKSFNKSIDRAQGEFVVMVTDDDPVSNDMLEFFRNLQLEHPNFSMYCGGRRVNTTKGQIEIIHAKNALQEILIPEKTIGIHWSSCLIKRSDLISIGKLADYGSGHLVDHLLLVFTGMQNGLVIVNREFSSIQLHDTNYSKSNINNYYLSCNGFYNFLSAHLPKNEMTNVNMQTAMTHLHDWFIGSFFNLRKYYTQKKQTDKIAELDDVAKKILELDFMKKTKWRYFFKKIIFRIKSNLKLV